MALAEFWESVRVRNPLFREGVPPPDVPRTTAEELDAELAKRQTWRTLGALKGFDEADFDFLAPAESVRLTGIVAAFNATAKELRSQHFRDPPDNASFAEAGDRARPLLRDIILQLGQDRYRTPDALRFGKLVERELAVSLPGRNLDLRFMVGIDWSGDRSLWAWVMLPLNIDTDDGERDFVHALSVLRQPVSDACRSAVPELFAYVSFRTTETPNEADEVLEDQPAGSAA